MAVNVEGEGRRRMAEIALHRLYIIAILKRQHRVSVPEIMKPFMRQASSFQGSVEALQNDAIFGLET